MLNDTEQRLRAGQDGSHLYVLCPACGNHVAGEFLMTTGVCNSCRQPVSTATPLRAIGPKEPPCTFCGWPWNPRWGRMCLSCGREHGTGRQLATPGVEVPPFGRLT